MPVNEFLLILGISAVAGVLTYLGAPVAEHLEVPQKVVNGALQFAAGVITALVAFSLMPPAVRFGSPVGIVGGFFAGGALFVAVEYISARRPASQSAAAAGASASLGLYVGILADLFIDGAVIGVGSTLTVATGLLLALGLAVGSAPLAFVTTATAKQQGMSVTSRRTLSILYIVCMIAGTAVGYLLLRNQSIAVRMVLVAFASGFLFATVTQSILPEASRADAPNLSGLLYVGGLSLYALMSLIAG